MATYSVIQPLRSKTMTNLFSVVQVTDSSLSHLLNQTVKLVGQWTDSEQNQFGEVEHGGQLYLVNMEDMVQKERNMLQ